MKVVVRGHLRILFLACCEIRLLPIENSVQCPYKVPDCTDDWPTPMTPLQDHVHRILTITDAAQAITDANACILAGRITEALSISRALDAWLPGNIPDPLVETDQNIRPYSIVVIAHQRVEGQKVLIDSLSFLDPGRFELIFVENASSSIFDIGPEMSGRNIRLFRMGANLGCGIARNIGFMTATGNGVILIDDDGQTNAQDIETLVQTFERHDASIVRGRVDPITAGAPRPDHYDLGPHQIQRFCDIEGFAIFRRSDILRVRGFDPVLYGHEGMDLTARLYPLVGPEAFLYEPSAVLYHDYAVDETKRAAKQARYDAIGQYCRQKTTGFGKLGGRFRISSDEPAVAAALRWRRILQDSPADQNPASVVAVINNTVTQDQFHDLLSRLNAQRSRAFELVLVDGRTSEIELCPLSRRLSPDIPRKVLAFPGASIATMLDAGIEAASNDLCLFADVQYGMIPQRIGLAKAAHHLFPGAGLLSLAFFTEDHPVTADQPVPFMPTSLAIMGLTGNLPALAALSLLRSRFPDIPRFSDMTANNAISEWVDRVVADGPADSVIIPVPVLFADTPFDLKSTDLSRIIQRHAAFLGSLRSTDHDPIARLSLASPTKTVEQRSQLRAYVSSMERVDPRPGLDMAALHVALRHRLAQIETQFFYDDQYRLKEIRRQLAEAASAGPE